MKIMSSLNYFNELAGRFNNGRFLQFNVYQKIFRDISGKIDIAKEDNLLDLGGGCGELTRLLAGRCRSIVLADGAEKTINYARRKLKDIKNIFYSLADITRLPLPFTDRQFDKVICYSVVHYANDLDNFSRLVGELIRIVRPAGVIFIGDIPLADKYEENLLNRKKRPFLNLLLNVKYRLKKFIIGLTYKFNGFNTVQVRGISYTKEKIAEALEKYGGIDYKLAAQDRQLPVADSREDLIIIKKNDSRN